MVGPLSRTENNSMLGGVCGGLGRYFSIDPVIVRLAFVLLTLAGGSGVLVYLVLWVLMPLDTQAASLVNLNPDERQRRTSLLVGGGLVLLGILSMLGGVPVFTWLNFQDLWPLILIVVGAILFVNSFRDRVN